MKNRIETIIQTLNISKKQFALSINLSPSTISDFLNGRLKSMSAETIVCIYKAYNINPIWLLTGEGEMFFTPQSMGEDAPGITSFAQLINTKWFNSLPAEEKKIITGLGIIKDRTILKKISDIITSQAAKEKSDCDLLELEKSLKRKKKK